MATTTSLKLPDELKERIADLTRGVAQTPHAYMVEAIAQKVGRDEMRRSFIESAQRSQEQFERTGIAYRAEDVHRYILGKAAGGSPRKPRPVKVLRAKR